MLRYVTCQCDIDVLLVFNVDLQCYLAFCPTCKITCDLPSIPFASLRGCFHMKKQAPQ